MRRPITDRSRAAIPSPATAPHAGSARCGSVAAMTAAHPSESARWTGDAATRRTAVRRSCGSTIAPAARAPSSRSSPRASDHAVDGMAEHAAPTRPAATASPTMPRGSRPTTPASSHVRQPDESVAVGLVERILWSRVASAPAWLSWRGRTEPSGQRRRGGIGSPESIERTGDGVRVCRLSPAPLGVGGRVWCDRRSGGRGACGCWGERADVHAEVRRCGVRPLGDPRRRSSDPWGRRVRRRSPAGTRSCACGCRRRCGRGRAGCRWRSGTPAAGSGTRSGCTCTARAAVRWSRPRPGRSAPRSPCCCRRRIATTTSTSASTR